MNYLFGSILVVIGLFLFVSALMKSKNVVYNLFVARSKILWGDHVHSFLLVVGVVIMGLSSLFFFGIWG
jgi:hypothetical protein